MNNLLIEYDSNWADEMNVNGFQVMTEVEFENYKKTVNRVFETSTYGWTFGIGTNQEIDYEKEKEFFNDIKVSELSDEEYMMFKKYFTRYDKMITYGFFPDIDYFETFLEDFE